MLEISKIEWNAHIMVRLPISESAKIDLEIEKEMKPPKASVIY